MERDLMSTKVSKVILEYIDKSDYDKNMKSFLKEILEFELDFQIDAEINDTNSMHKYTQKYKELIQKYCGDQDVSE